MLVNASRMLKIARDGHYAVGQFNINNLEWTKAVLTTAQELNSPVILGVSEGAAKYMTGFKTVAAMVRAMDESLGITVPVAPPSRSRLFRRGQELHRRRIHVHHVRRLSFRLRRKRPEDHRACQPCP